MFNLFKKNREIAPRKLYDMYSEDLYVDVEDAKVSRLIGFSTNNFDFSQDNVISRLKAGEYVNDVIIDDEQASLVVFTNYSGVQEQVTLHCFPMSSDLGNYMKMCSLFGNFGVDASLLEQVMNLDMYIYSEMLFNKEDPLASYQTQVYILQLAMDLSVIFDESSRKVLYSSYVDLVLNCDLKYYVKNLFSTISVDSGWMYTVGLSRFYLKDYEVNKIEVTPGLFNILGMEVLKQFECGTAKSGTTQKFSEGIFVTFVDIEDACKFLSTKFLGKPSFRGEEFMKDYQVLLYTSTLEFELEKIESKLIHKNFSLDVVQMVPTVVTENIRQTILNSEDYFNRFIVETGLYKLMFIKFGMETGEEVEFIWGQIRNIDNNGFEMELLNQSIYNENATIGSIVRTTYNSIVDWEMTDEIPFPLFPYNLYILENPVFYDYVNSLKLNEM